MESRYVGGLSVLFCAVALLLVGGGLQTASAASCRSHMGENVPYIADTSLNNVGMAIRRMGRPVIIMNPNILNRFSPLVRQWWMAHECAHHALPPIQNSEVSADCYATKVLRQFGLISSWPALRQLMIELSGLPGNLFTGHLPGPQRAQQVRNCFMMP